MVSHVEAGGQRDDGAGLEVQHRATCDGVPTANAVPEPCARDVEVRAAEHLHALQRTERAQVDVADGPASDDPESHHGFQERGLD